MQTCKPASTVTERFALFHFKKSGLFRKRLFNCHFHFPLRLIRSHTRQSQQRTRLHRPNVRYIPPRRWRWRRTHALADASRALLKMGFFASAILLDPRGRQTRSSVWTVVVSVHSPKNRSKRARRISSTASNTD